MIHREVIFSRIRDFRPLALDLHVPKNVDRPPVVVWIHGGGFREGDRRSQPRTVRPRSIFDALTDAGLACATVDYRLAGEAVWPAQRDDVDAAIEYLAAHADDYGIAADLIGTWGDSAGGRLALVAALTNPQVKATVAWYPLTDIAALDEESGGLPESLWLGGLPSAMPERLADASPITRVTAEAPPSLLVHGQDDSVYPASQSERMHRRLIEAGAESACRIVPGADHVFHGYGDVSGLIDESVGFLSKNLTSPRIKPP